MYLQRRILNWIALLIFLLGLLAAVVLPLQAKAQGSTCLYLDGESQIWQFKYCTDVIPGERYLPQEKNVTEVKQFPREQERHDWRENGGRARLVESFYDRGHNHHYR